MASKVKTSNRAEKAKETKEKIYKSAEQLFSKYAFDDITINSIVELAGVAKGSFYVHFDSKDALIASFISDYVKKVDADYKTYLESFPADALASDILVLMVEKIAGVIMDSIGYDSMKTLYKVLLVEDINTEAVVSYNRDLYNIFANIITNGIEQGEFCPESSVDSLTKYFVMAFRGLTYEWCIRYPDFDLKKETVQYYRILITGIKNK